MWCPYIQHLLFVVKEHILTREHKFDSSYWTIFSFPLRAKRVYITAKTKKLQALMRKQAKKGGSKNIKTAKKPANNKKKMKQQKKK